MKTCIMLDNIFINIFRTNCIAPPCVMEWACTEGADQVPIEYA